MSANLETAVHGAGKKRFVDGSPLWVRESCYFCMDISKWDIYFQHFHNSWEEHSILIETSSGLQGWFIIHRFIIYVIVEYNTYTHKLYLCQKIFSYYISHWMIQNYAPISLKQNADLFSNFNLKKQARLITNLLNQLKIWWFFRLTGDIPDLI